MPAPRRTGQLVERQTDHRDGIKALIAKTERYLTDGIDELEGRDILAGLAALLAGATLVSVDLAFVDSAVAIAQTLLNTGDPTTAHVHERFVRANRDLNVLSASTADAIPASLPDLPLAIAGGASNGEHHP